MVSASRLCIGERFQPVSLRCLVAYPDRARGDFVVPPKAGDLSRGDRLPGSAGTTMAAFHAPPRTLASISRLSRSMPWGWPSMPSARGAGLSSAPDGRGQRPRRRRHHERSIRQSVARYGQVASLHSFKALSIASKAPRPIACLSGVGTISTLG